MEDSTKGKEGGGDAAKWAKATKNVCNSVVTIEFCHTHCLDMEDAGSGSATGFVVDAEKGYILTNRHVVSAGPFWGHCKFFNKEKCDVFPVYRDPVHDFSILHFDPKKIKHMHIMPLKLHPDLAKVGVEIRLVGNDAGETLSILSGFISRLDRNAPEYSEGYCDFNTNYIQAAAATSGGSSGSPVVNIDGYAVALHAGGNCNAATDFFLPLDQPLRALRCIQEGKQVTRGTIQTQWLLKSYDECCTLGLTTKWEKDMRGSFENETGLLVAEVVLPNGPADTKLKGGDILLEINGKVASGFIQLENVLDSHVGQTVSILVQRSGQDIEIEVTVCDLDTITPKQFLEVCGAIIHDISYQQARRYHLPLQNGVYVSYAQMTFEQGWLVQSVDNKETPNLEALIKVMEVLPNGAQVPVTYKIFPDPNRSRISAVRINRHWWPETRLATRNDTTGLWDFIDLADRSSPLPRLKETANFIMGSDKTRKFIHSSVKVSAHMAERIDGCFRHSARGSGLIVDVKRGLVLVSRGKFPHDFGDIFITIADSVEIPAKVIFNYNAVALLQYDPDLIIAPIEEMVLSDEELKLGERVEFFGFDIDGLLVTAETTVTNIELTSISTDILRPANRAHSFDAVTTDTIMTAHCESGVFVSEGYVKALWLTHFGADGPVRYCLMTQPFTEAINQLKNGTTPNLRVLDIEVGEISKKTAHVLGVATTWIGTFANEQLDRHRFFIATKVGFENCGLKESDVVLKVGAKNMTKPSVLNIYGDDEMVEVIVVRGGKEISLSVQILPTEIFETSHVVKFCGMVLQPPHHAVRQEVSRTPSSVYCSFTYEGSPAHLFGIRNSNFIISVNGAATPTLKIFLQEVDKINDSQWFSVGVISIQNIPKVFEMKKIEHYFPTEEYIKDPTTELGWRVTRKVEFK